MNLLILGLLKQVPTSELSDWVGSIVGTRSLEVKYAYDSYLTLRSNLLDYLNWCDVMVCPNNWISEAEILHLLVGLVQVTHEITVVFENPEVENWLDRIVTPELAFRLKQHRFFQLGIQAKRISLSAKALAWMASKKF